MKDLDLDKLRVHREAGTAAPATRRRRRLWPWLMLVAAAVGAGAWLQMPATRAVQTSQVVSAWPSQQYELLSATGYVVAQRKTAVSAKGTGRLVWIGPSEGDHVKEGEVIARLESQDVEARHRAAVANTAVAAAAITTAQSELSDATTNLQRTQTLFDKKLVSLLNLQDASSRLARAKASVASAQASLAAAQADEAFARTGIDYTQIRAPFNGTVISRNANIGDIVTPVSSAADAKGSVLELADMSTLEVNADVSESSLARIKVGQPCEITLDAFPERRFRGEVSVVVPAVNRSSATVTTKVRILDSDPSILPDMSARVSFLSQRVEAEQNQPVLAVNPTAVVERGGRHVVYVPNGTVAREVPVKTGATLGAVLAIEGPLKVGDTVVLDPVKIINGSHLKLATQR